MAVVTVGPFAIGVKYSVRGLGSTGPWRGTGISNSSRRVLFSPPTVLLRAFCCARRASLDGALELLGADGWMDGGLTDAVGEGGVPGLSGDSARC